MNLLKSQHAETNKSHNYFEILKTVGVDRPTDMLFVTDSFQEAVVAKTAGNLFLELIFLFLQIITLVINVMS